MYWGFLLLGFFLFMGSYLNIMWLHGSPYFSFSQNAYKLNIPIIIFNKYSSLLLYIA